VALTGQFASEVPAKSALSGLFQNLLCPNLYPENFTETLQTLQTTDPFTDISSGRRPREIAAHLESLLDSAVVVGIIGWGRGATSGIARLNPRAKILVATDVYDLSLILSRRTARRSALYPPRRQSLD
jgi:hypothetical protein